MTNQTTRRNVITGVADLPLLPASAPAAPTTQPLLPVSAFAALAEAPAPNHRKEGGGVRRHRPPLARRDMPREFCAMIFGKRFGRIARVRRSMSVYRRIADLAPKGAEGRFMTQLGHSSRTD